METSTVTLGTLIDRALLELQTERERGRTVTLDGAINSSVTSMDLATGTATESDLIQFGDGELVQVTSKSTNTYGILRGYNGTTPASHSDGDAGEVNPQFSRRRAAEAIRRAPTRMEALGVPLITSAALSRETDEQLMEVPAEALQVYDVIYVSPTTGLPHPIEGWRFYQHLPVATSSTGKALGLPYFVTDDNELQVVYRKSYAWSSSPAWPLETATLEVPTPAIDLPAQYAAAWLTTGREVSRAWLDRSEEYGHAEQTRVQSGAAIARMKWQEFYRSLDEVMRVLAVDVPKRRPLVKIPKTIYRLQ